LSGVVVKAYKKAVFVRGLRARAESYREKGRKKISGLKKRIAALKSDRRMRLIPVFVVLLVAGYFAAGATGQYLGNKYLASACKEVQDKLNADPILLSDCKCAPSLESPNETLPGTNTSLSNTTTGQCKCNCYNSRLGARQEITVVRSQP